ncbi:DMT family transporter [Nocardioides sp. NPDC057772]|uniref:DMT family transporter n=1 Tax=Nocardioides sp. NPDC057772 TaxID=3346245 RepID=UPI00366E1DB7
MFWGFVGIVAFSLTVPMTRIAVGGLSPLLIGAGRAVVAALLAALVLAITRQPLPARPSVWARLAVVAGGVVVGFPVLTSYALGTVPAAHGAVVIAVLPAVTAVAVVLRTAERPSYAFWFFSVVGAAVVVAFLAVQGGGLGQIHLADLLLIAAVLACALGYMEGGLLSRELGSWQTISWALVLASPLMVALTAVALVQQPPSATPGQIAAFGYLAVVSMFLGFFAWYRGLAIGPMTTVSQIQLLQPVLTITWAALLLGEHVGTATLIGAVAVIICAAGAVRSRNVQRPQAADLSSRATASTWWVIGNRSKARSERSR